MCLAAVSCGGGSGSSNPLAPLVASFEPSATGPAPDRVRLRGTAIGDEVFLEVELGGPHAASDLYSFGFDLEADPAVVELTAFEAGDLFDPADSATFASQQGDRIVVGVSLLEPTPPAALASTSAVLIHLALRVRDGSTPVRFAGAPINPAGDPGPAALDRDEQVLPQILFDTSSATITGSR